MKLQKYLNESKVENKDKAAIKKFIKNTPRSQTDYTLKSFADNYTEDERELEVYRTTDKGIGVTFVYNTDFYELTAFLVDTIDGMKNLSFDLKDERSTNMTYFSINSGKTW